MLPILSFDIGSTYTKGALFDLEPGRPRLLRRESLPTTVDDLSAGFFALFEKLRPAEENETPLYACSSAKGGLAIAALGIVPDLTLHVAKLAAASAGGKIVAAYSYKLAEEQIAELEQTPPDVILFSGGTDGGNEDYNLHNARMLTEAKLPSAVLYAGNAALRSEIRNILGGGELFFAENLMPEVGTLNIEPAREKIQEIFLERIVEGKGLAAIGSLCTGELKPTPRAVFDLVAAMSEQRPEWNDFALIDLGGATTDFYSCAESFRGEAGYVLKGLREPKLKRSVEGDLGMRVSARSIWESGRDHIERQLGENRSFCDDFTDYLSKISERTDYLPQSTHERRFDEILAGACIHHSLRRHAGSIEESYIPTGRIFVQQGKDLRGVKKMILSGGYLSTLQTAELCQAALTAAREHAGEMQLLPEQVEFFVDKQYLFPLLGNLAIDHPREAARLAEENLMRI
jgi:uncharacterized protein (TIGR01319 family)